MKYDGRGQSAFATIRERDNNRCQHTGRVLRLEEGSLGHVVPRSRGGKDAWENLVWAAKDVNQRQADHPTNRPWRIGRLSLGVALIWAMLLMKPICTLPPSKRKVTVSW